MTIAKVIFESVAKAHEQEVSRGYLGMSSVARPCKRAAWYQWREATGDYLDGRILLLFEVGHKVEEVMCQALRTAGYSLLNAWPDKQLSYKDLGGFFGGHPDGIIEDSDQNLILEIKSANSNRFKMFKKKGVLEVYPAYYGQMQLYMGYARLYRALLVVMNKENSDIYTEMVIFDEDIFEALKKRAADILTTHDADGVIKIPERGFKANDQECKWCAYRTVCHEKQDHLQIKESCRSCHFLYIGADFKPWCKHPEHSVELTDISKCCGEWDCLFQSPPF